jgi:hypothetical protein
MPLDLLEDPRQDPKDDADFELPDPDALIDTFLAGLSKESNIEVEAISVTDAEAISVTAYSGIGSRNKGNLQLLLSNKAIVRVFLRLVDRLQGVASNASMVIITPEYAVHFLQVYVKKTD